jgi:hypothetical protein
MGLCERQRVNYRFAVVINVVSITSVDISSESYQNVESTVSLQNLSVRPKHREACHQRPILQALSLPDKTEMSITWAILIRPDTVTDTELFSVRRSDVRMVKSQGY